MKRIAVIALIAFACGGILFLSTCKKENPASSSVSQLAVGIKDAPAHCDRARIEIRGIRVYSLRDGWITIPMNDTILDILQLQDTSAILGVVNLEAGTITQVHVILGMNDTVTVGGIEYALDLTDSDLIVKVNDTLTSNSSFTLVVDINAAQSIFDDGTGGHHHYHLQGSASCIFRKGGHWRHG